MRPIKASLRRRALIGMRQTLDNILVQNKQVDYDGRSIFFFLHFNYYNVAQECPVDLAKRMTQAERTDLSDRLMRDAAIELIVEQGTAATTLKDVGEKAGYSRGLAGYRFGSRDALFSFVVHSLGEDWLQTAHRGHGR